MASVARQPFAPLDSARLQNLTSIKNRQNALIPNSSTKRKASLIEDTDDFENVDPGHTLKRSKGLKGLGSLFPSKEVYKSVITLTKAETPVPATTTPLPSPFSTPLSVPVAPSTKHIASPPRRSALAVKNSARLSLSNGITKPSAVSQLGTPAGRSPPRSKRVGLLSSRRHIAASPYARIDPPALSAPATPFSLDAALKGSIPSYAARSRASALSAGKKVARTSSSDLDSSSMKDSWFFDIHEDTPEQEMTNMLQHSTCTLDISSDEETQSKQRRERDEGRDKENVPPSDDVSQTSQQRRRVGAESAQMSDENAMLVEAKLDARVALREMDAREFFADGCDENSIFVVPGDDDAETVVDETEQREREPCEPKDFIVYAEDVPLPEDDGDLVEDPVAKDDILTNVPSVEELMKRDDTRAGAKAAVLEPVEGTRGCESFEVWESSSAKDENENRSREASPAPLESYCEFSQTAAALEFI